MFKNYLVAALRSMAKQRLFSAINILGLAIGLAACILILLFVRDELSFDRQWDDAGSIYKIETRIGLAGRAPIEVGNTQEPLRQALLDDIEQIAAATRIDPNETPLALGDRRFFETIVTVDDNFFDFFALEFLAGDARSALQDINSIVLSETTARKYFGDGPALGQRLTADYETEMLVTGVIRDLPETTHLEFDGLRLFNPAAYGDAVGSWRSLGFLTYIRLRGGASIEAVEAALPALVRRHVPSDLAESLEVASDELFQFRPLGLSEIHFHSWGGMRETGNLSAIYAFTGIALLILLIAAINFVNLSTAKASGRAREVAMRKVLGAQRKDLIKQFLGESVGTSLVALLLALVLVELAMPFYNQALSRLLEADIAGSPMMLAGALLLTLVVGLGAGVHPALVLSGFRPARVLKSGQSRTDKSTSRLRFLLVTVQFAISIGLIVSTAVLSAQTRYARTFDGGFTKQNMLILRNLDNPHVAPLAAPLLLALKGHPDVISTARSMAVPGDDEINIMEIEHPTLSSDGPTYLNTVAIDYGFLQTFGVKPLAGRLFDPARRAEARRDEGAEEDSLSPSIVINLATTKLLGFADPEDAIGQAFYAEDDGQRVVWTIIGVVPDVQMYSVHQEIEPTGFMVDYDNLGTVTVNFRTNDLERFTGEIDRIWADIIAAAPIEREFLSDNLDALYADEEAQALLLGIFAILAVIVSCLGLLGLAAFTADRSTKEIGIRKTFGASVPQIIRRMAWQFSKPVLVANLIAWPAAWYFLSGWLEDYAYRIDLSPVYFALAGGGALALAWLTVAAHTARVARSNPINALRYE